jgi:hypothetical protein
MIDRMGRFYLENLKTRQVKKWLKVRAIPVLGVRFWVLNLQAIGY